MYIDGYRVIFSEFSNRHYIKQFEKKHRNHWAVTRRAIVAQLERIDLVIQSSKADLIKKSETHWLIKLDFAVAGRDTSPKASGNRLIAHVDNETKTVTVLLVYSKNDISVPNETQKWQTVTKQQFPDIWMLYN